MGDDEYRSRGHRDSAARSRSRSPRRSRHDDRDRSRSRSPRGDRHERRRSPRASNGQNDSYDNTRGGAQSYDDRQAPKDNMSKPQDSQQDRRVYVGNLSYDVKWHHLKDFMRKDNTLEVIHADVLTMPNGMSKGCGIVEYATREDAQTAIDTMSNTQLMGRLVYVREDRETEPRFAGGAGGRGGGPGGFGGRGGGFQGGFQGGMGGGGGYGGGRPQVYVSNLPFSVGWQDLKDLFRQAGNVVRADVHMAPDGTPKGSGVVAFDTPQDAQNAINIMNGYDWQGRLLEVREDRYAGGGAGGYGGGRGGFGGGFGGRGGFQGGYGGGFQQGGRGGFGGGRGGFGGGFGGRGGFQGGFQGAAAGGNFGGAAPVAPNPFTDGVASGGAEGPIIHVKNLPWSTSNEDLVELFTTIGKVERAEIQYEPNGRSRGSGVVEFASQPEASTAIEKFQGYQYGGRPLQLDYAKYPSDGGEMEGQEPTGNMQQM